MKVFKITTIIAAAALLGSVQAHAVTGRLSVDVSNVDAINNGTIEAKQRFSGAGVARNGAGAIVLQPTAVSANYKIRNTRVVNNGVVKADQNFAGAGVATNGAAAGLLFQ